MGSERKGLSALMFTSIPALIIVSSLIAILVAPIVVAIIVSIVLYRRSRQHRAISCTFESAEHPVEIKAGPGLAGDIEILYRGQKVSNLYVVRATIRNTGNVQILASDFVEPLAFSFQPGTRLVGEPSTTSAAPMNLTTEWSIDTADSATQPTNARVDLPLLNPGDHFTAEFVYTGDGALPTVSARIAGVLTADLWDVGRTKDDLPAFFLSGEPTIQIIRGLALAFIVISVSALTYGTAKDIPPTRITVAISGAVTFWAVIASQLMHVFHKSRVTLSAKVFAFLLAFILTFAFGAWLINWSFIDQFLNPFI